MPLRFAWTTPLVAAVAVSCFLMVAADAGGRRIGAAGAVKNEVEGIVDGRAAPLSTGAALVQDQRVRTGEASTAQLLFLDETSLNVGPRSDVTLDRFVYDPGRSKNDIALSATKGIFRFISGSSDPRSYHLKTPVATIGVRGTIYDLIAGANEAVVILVEGRLVIDLPDGRQVTLDRPGKALRIHRGGRVEGPITWDGTLYKVVGVAPYPLFGTTFLPEPRQVEWPDTRQEIVNDLDAVDTVHGLPPCARDPRQC